MQRNEINHRPFGVEHEFFIFGENEEPPTVVQTELLFRILHSKGFTPNPKTNSLLTAHKDSKEGFVSIKNDFCTHILEVAFPPFTKKEEFSGMFESTMQIIDETLRELGLARRKNSILNTPPLNQTIISCPRGTWMLNREVPEKKYAEKLLTTKLVSTQIHIQYQAEKALNHFQNLFSLDYLAPLLLSNSKSEITGEHCIRPLVWRDSFPDSYNLFAFPKMIPSTREEYQAQKDHSNDFQRDYSFIVPREIGTIEFRSMCSQPDLERVLEGIALRLGQLRMSEVRKSNQIHNFENMRDHFYQACESGYKTPGIRARTTSDLSEMVGLVSADWRREFERLEMRNCDEHKKIA